MDTGSLVSSLIQSLAWPITALVIAFLFKGPISDLLGRLKEVKLNHFRAKFIRDLNQAKEVVHDSLPSDPTVSTPAGMEASVIPIPWLESNLRLLLDTYPSAAILLAWSGLEREIRQAAVRVDPSLPAASKINERIALATLVKRNIISDAVVDVVDTLRGGRNEVMHEPGSGSPLERDVTMRYSELAFALINHLRKSHAAD